jgi:peptide/nickel transport system permease protein
MGGLTHVLDIAKSMSKNSVWNEFWYRFRRNWIALAALIFIILTGLLAILAPLLVGNDPFVADARALLPPFSLGHWLGTDSLGHDTWTQLIFGARVSLLVGLLAALSAGSLGVAVGSLAGFWGGWVDSLLMRISDFFQTLPRFVLALLIVALFGTGLAKLIFVIAILSWPQMARLVRAQFLSLREALFIEAARVNGMGTTAIIVREILPNTFGPILVVSTLDVAGAILLEASLGFFGLGDPNLVSWGSMLNTAQPYLQRAWWLSVFPGLAISLVVLAFNIVGDGLNNALNPRTYEAH